MSTAFPARSTAAHQLMMDEQYGEGSGMILHVIEEVREIARIEDINGPAGRQLGLRIKAALNGRPVSDLTIGELRAICEQSSRDYNDEYNRVHGVEARDL